MEPVNIIGKHKFISTWIAPHAPQLTSDHWQAAFYSLLDAGYIKNDGSGKYVWATAYPMSVLYAAIRMHGCDARAAKGFEFD